MIRPSMPVAIVAASAKVFDLFGKLVSHHGQVCDLRLDFGLSSHILLALFICNHNG